MRFEGADLEGWNAVAPGQGMSVASRIWGGKEKRTAKGFFPVVPGRSVSSLDMGPMMLISDFWL